MPGNSNLHIEIQAKNWNRGRYPHSPRQPNAAPTQRQGARLTTKSRLGIGGGILSAWQQVIQLAERWAGQDQRFSLLQPSPVFGDCRFQLGSFNVSERLDLRSYHIDPASDPLQFFPLPGDSQIFSARPALSPTAFATCSPAARCRSSAPTLAPSGNGCFRRLKYFRQAHRAPTTLDPELRLITGLDYDTRTGAKRAWLDDRGNRDTAIGFICCIHTLHTLLDAGVEKPNSRQ